jgi:hypothetical protein
MPTRSTGNPRQPGQRSVSTLSRNKSLSSQAVHRIVFFNIYNRSAVV